MTIASHRGEARNHEPHPGVSRGGVRRTRRAAALALIVAGLVLLGDVGWQLWGTNWVSHRKQERIISALEQAWDQGGGKPGGKPGDASVDVAEGQATALVRIPAFGQDYVVPVLEGTSDEVLAAGYGHFEDTADPGRPGNYVLAAHRITHGEPLRRMPELQPGDEVIVETRNKIFTYVLDTGGDDLIVGSTEGWVADPLPDNPDAGEPEPAQEPGQRLITLTTCSELFHTDNRMIAFGHLKTVTWKH